MLAPALGHLRIALPAPEEQPVGTVAHQVAAVALFRPRLGPVGAVLLPLIGGGLEVVRRLAGGPPQDPAVWPRLDLGDHAPHEQDDLTGAVPTVGGWGGEGGGGDTKKLSLGKVSQGRGLRGREEGWGRGAKPPVVGQEGR